MSIMPGQVIICNDCGQYGYRVTHVNPPILPVGWCEVPVNRKLVHTCAECTKKCNIVCAAGGQNGTNNMYLGLCTVL